MDKVFKKKVGDLERENLEMRCKLGLATPEEMKKYEARQVFDELDVDGNGSLSQEEFQLLAYKCGAVVPEEKVKKNFALIDTNGNGSIDFDEFYTWLVNYQQNHEDSEWTPELGWIASKLQWQDMEERIKEVELPKDLLEGVEKKAQSTQSFNVSVKVGDPNAEDYKSGIKSVYKVSADQLKDIQKSIGSNSNNFVCFDFSLKENATAEDVGEMVGALKGFTAMGTQMLEQKMGEAFKGIKIKRVGNVLRVALMAEFDVNGEMQKKLGLQVHELFDELSVDLNTTFGEEYLLKGDANPSKFFQGTFDVNAKVNTKIAEIGAKLANRPRRPRPGRKGMAFRPEQRVGMPAPSFLKNVNLGLEFGALEELFDSVPAMKEHPLMKDGPKAIQELAQKIEKKSLSKLPPDMLEIYTTLISNISGLSAVRIQVGEIGLGLEFYGFDLTQFLPKMEAK